MAIAIGFADQRDDAYDAFGIFELRGSELLVTIGICCFDAADTIERSIRAAQAQDWPDLEILVVDDCSTDGSVEIVARLAESDSRIRLIRHAENKGTGGTRNTILREARGAFIAFQDDDDESAPDRISRQFELLRDAGDLAVCFVSRMAVKAGKAPEYSRAMGANAPARGDDIVFFLLCGDQMPGGGRYGSGTMMASAGTFRAVGQFDESFRRGEELDWVVRLAVKGGEVRGIAEPLLTQHITAGNEKGRSANLRAVLDVRRKHRDFLRSRRAYIASILYAYQKYFYSGGQRNMMRLAALAMLFLRPRVTLGFIRSKHRVEHGEPPDARTSGPANSAPQTLD